MSVNTQELQNRTEILNRINVAVEKIKKVADDHSRTNLIKLSADKLRDVQGKVDDLSGEVQGIFQSISTEQEAILEQPLKHLASVMDDLSKRVASVASENFSFYTRFRNSLKKTPDINFSEEYWKRMEKRKFDEAVSQEMEKIKKEWNDSIIEKFEAPEDAAARAHVSKAVQRWVTPYLSPGAAEDLRRRKEAFDKVRAVKEVYSRQNSINSNLQEMGVSLGYVMKATLGTSMSVVEEGIVKGGQALLMGLGGPGFAAAMLAWKIGINLPVGALNLTAGVLGGADKLLEIAWDKIKKMNDGATNRFAKMGMMAGMGLLALPALALRAVTYFGSAIASGIASGLKSFQVATERGFKKNIVPILGLAGTAAMTYFVAISLASAFTFGIPLAITLGGLAAASVGAALSAWWKGKKKLKEYRDMSLSPDEMLMLQRHDYVERQKRTPIEAPKQRQNNDSQSNNNQVPGLNNPLPTASAHVRNASEVGSPKSPELEVTALNSGGIREPNGHPERLKDRLEQATKEIQNIENRGEQVVALPKNSNKENGSSGPPIILRTSAEETSKEQNTKNAPSAASQDENSHPQNRNPRPSTAAH